MVHANASQVRPLAVAITLAVAAVAVLSAQERAMTTNTGGSKATVYVDRCATPVIAYLSHAKKQLWLIKDRRAEVAEQFKVKKEEVSASQWTVVAPGDEKLRVSVVEVERSIPPGVIQHGVKDATVHDKSKCNGTGSVVNVSCQNFESGRSYEVKALSYKTCNDAEKSVCLDSNEKVATEYDYPKPNCQGEATTKDLYSDSCTIPK